MTSPAIEPAGKPSSARSNLVRVIAATLIALLVLLAGAATGLLFVRHQLTVQSSSIAPANSATRQARQAMADADSAVRAFQLTGESDVLAPLPQADSSLQESLLALAGFVGDDPELQARVDRQEQAATTWWQQYAAPVAAGHRPTAAEQQPSATAYEAFRHANVDLSDLVRDRSTALLRQTQVVVAALLAGMAIWTAVGGLLVLVPAIRTLRLIGPPLEGLGRTVGRLRRGDLAARADSSHGVVEIRDVAAALNDLAAESQSRHERDADDLRLAAAVREISAVIGSSLDLPTVARGTAAAVAARFPAATVWVRVFDDPNDKTSTGYAAHCPDDPTWVSPVELIPAGRRIAAAAWRRRDAYLLQRNNPVDRESVSEEEAAAILAVIGGAGADAVLFVPVGVGPDCLGYLGLGRDLGQPDWRPTEIEALLSVGRDLGRAVVHSRLFARESVLVRELRDLDATKNDFVAMVSHELRTPLASIIGHLEIVRSGDLGPVDPEMDPSLSAIDRNAVRLTTLIEDLLLLSRIEQRSQPATLRPLDLAVVAREVVDLHAGPAAGKHTELRLVVPGGPAPVLGNHLELERVLGNLVGNALKYSPPGSAVHLSLITSPDAVTVEVSDNGIGISAEDLGQLFEKFFRSSDPAARAVSGTGLGLAITRAIVTKHGGTITATSTVGAGSTFAVTLPRLRETSDSTDLTIPADPTDLTNPTDPTNLTDPARHLAQDCAHAAA